MNITIEHIKHVAKYNPILLVKGSAIYRQNNILDSNVDLDANDVIVMDGTVRDNENILQSQVKIVEGEIIEHSCTCYERKTEGTCRHVISLLYLYMYELFDKEVMRLMEKNSDPLAIEMIDSYLMSSLQQIQSGGDVSGVEIIPKMNIDLDGEVSLNFQIGIDRKYILRDIDQFIVNVQEENLFSYGKSLSFKHQLSSFDSQSRELVAFMERRRNEINMILQTTRSSYSYYYGNTNYQLKKNMVLTPNMIDEVIDLYLDKDLTIATDGQPDAQYRILKENPALSMSIIERNKDQYVLKMNSAYLLLQGAKRFYIAIGSIIYIADEDYQKQMNRFLRAMYLNQNSLIMHHQHMNAFYNSVYEVIRKYIQCEIHTDLSQYEPIPVSTRLYFDAYGNGGVSVAVKFVYDDKEYWHGIDQPSDHRNIAEETKMLLLVKKYFTNEAENGLFTIIYESQLFHLVSEGFDELSNYCELYYSDDFKNIKLKQSPMISAGVRLSEGLLHVNFDVQDFDLKELKQLLAAYKQNRKYYRAKDGSFMQLDQGSLSSLSELMEGFHLTEKDILKKEITIPKYRAMQMDAFIKNNEQMKFDRDRAFKKLIRDFSSVSDSDFEIDADLKPILRNYQKSGYRWLKTMSAYQFGGILADDMGLGKTIQVIALLKNLKSEYEAVEHNENDKHPISIVICPASLVLNWEKEIERFAPQLRTLVVIGGVKQRQDLIDQVDDYDVIVTSYDLLKRDVEAYQKIQFFYQIIDEAQYIKNHTTLAAKTVKDIQSIQRFALSGTPVENSLAELWSIFDYLMPNYLYPYNYFKTNYEVPIVKDGDQEVVTKLKRMVQPFILRRLKKDVLKELPDKMESTMYCQLEGEQQKLYVANAIEMSRDLREKFQEAGLEQNKFMVLALLTKLRQLCCHPRLAYDNYHGESAKLDMCMELVRNSVEGNHQVLIFSSFTSMLAIIKQKLNEEGIPFFELTGATAKFKRMELVNEFQNGAVPVFLISLKAGGTGLNLTAADVVIHFDPWWNISAQNQATDRTHRIGQTSNVNVYNLIAKDTIEEKILKLQDKKRNLADAIVEEGGNMIGSMSKDDILSLFEV